MAPKKEQFQFLNPVDGNTYTLPPYDPEKVSQEFVTHADYIPKVDLTEALLADDPAEGDAMLRKPMQAWNTLFKRVIIRTLRNHLEIDDPAWLALKSLTDAAEWDVLAKVFADWQAFYDVKPVDPVGED